MWEVQNFHDFKLWILSSVSARRFFKKHGKSDGLITAYLPSDANDGTALWRLEHLDGDEEDLDEEDVLEVCTSAYALVYGYVCVLLCEHIQVSTHTLCVLMIVAHAGYRGL
jgi:hypothetical protein